MTYHGERKCQFTSTDQREAKEGGTAHDLGIIQISRVPGESVQASTDSTFSYVPVYASVLQVCGEFIDEKVAKEPA